MEDKTPLQDNAAATADGTPAPEEQAQAIPLTAVGEKPADFPQPETPADSTGQEQASEKEKEEADNSVSVEPSLPEDDLPEDEAVSHTATSPHNKYFRALAHATPFTLLLFLAALCWPVFIQGDLYCPMEVQNLELLKSLAEAPLLPNSPDMVSMPVFPWMTHLIQNLPFPLTLTTPLVSVVGAFITLLGVWLLCRCCRLGAPVALASALVLFASPLFLALSQFIGPVTAATGFSLASLAVLTRGWMKKENYPAMLAGYLLAALALLTGGLYFGLVPPIAGALFCIWRGDFKRSRNFDALIGFAVFLAAIAIWAAATIFTTEGVPPGNIVTSLVGLPDFDGRWWTPYLFYLVSVLPFILVLFCASWARIFRDAGKDLRASRKENAHAILWFGLLASLLLSLISPHTANIFLATAITAVLAGKTMMRLAPNGVKVYYILVTLFLLFIGVAFLFLTIPGLQELALEKLELTLSKQAQEILNDLGQCGIACTIIGAALPIFSGAAILHVAWRSRTSAAPILVTALMVLFMAQPTGIMAGKTLSSMASLKMTHTWDSASAKPASPEMTDPFAVSPMRGEITEPTPAPVEPKAESRPVTSEKAPAAPKATAKEAPAATEPQTPAASDPLTRVPGGQSPAGRVIQAEPALASPGKAEGEPEAKSADKPSVKAPEQPAAQPEPQEHQKDVPADSAAARSKALSSQEITVPPSQFKIPVKNLSEAASRAITAQEMQRREPAAQ